MYYIYRSVKKDEAKKEVICWYFFLHGIIFIFGSTSLLCVFCVFNACFPVSIGHKNSTRIVSLWNIRYLTIVNIFNYNHVFDKNIKNNLQNKFDRYWKIFVLLKKKESRRKEKVRSWCQLRCWNILLFVSKLKMANIHRFGCFLLKGITRTSYEAPHIHITLTNNSNLCLLLKFLTPKKSICPYKKILLQHINICHKDDKF